MKLQQNKSYLKFPLGVESGGLRTADRAQHIRDQIEQLLFTAPGERVLRPKYGAGVQKLVFEPNNSYLSRITEKRIHGALINMLQGVAAPESIEVAVKSEEETLYIDISYTLVDVNLKQELSFSDATLSVDADPAATLWDFEEEKVEEPKAPRLRLDFKKASDGTWSAGRTVENLPRELPVCEDDFDWRQRDWDSIRVAMLQDLKRSFPQRDTWSDSDLESVLVELLAYGLDMLSDKADRVMREAFLETAADPDRLKRFIDFIGYNAFADLPEGVTDIAAWWREHPQAMERARRNAPASVVQQERMVTVEDYRIRLEDHPLVKQALATSSWDGSSEVITVTLILSEGLELDSPLIEGALSEELFEALRDFHRALDLTSSHTGLCWMPEPDGTTTPRILLKRYIDLYRMAGRRVVLKNVESVPIDLRLSVSVADNFYESEILIELKRVLSAEPGGFFEPGRLRFGEPVTMGDIMEWTMAVEGVANVQIERLKALGNRPDLSGLGYVSLRSNEVATIGTPPPVVHLKGGMQG